MRDLLEVGLTGGIGSGKSLVVDYFARLGAATINFDLVAREVIARGSEGFDRVLARFGDEILTGGEINRAALAALIFDDRAARADLESIIHPLVRAAYADFCSVQAPHTIVVAEIPLLVESTYDYTFDQIITISADLAIRKERLAARGMSAAQIEARITAQGTDPEREARADFVIHNNGDIDSLLRNVEQIFAALVELNSGKN